MLKNECMKELTQHIIPFWSKLEDKENGGFYGYVGYNLETDKKADKGVILHGRILWFYSNCYAVLGDEECLRLARHAYEFIKDYCVDYDNGGVYWMVDYQGKPVDTMKHTYNIAFAIYVLSAFYNATGEKDALSLAMRLFDDIEAKTLDEYGYREAFSIDWKLIENDALSENGLNADKTMNAVLHLIEAYTELYKANENERVEQRLRFLLSQMENIVYDAKTDRLRVFFDTAFNEIGDVHSFGHDIEASWLIDRACEVLGDEKLIKKFGEIDLRIAKSIKENAFDGVALYNETDKGVLDKKRVWWVQAEAVLGFINAYKKTGDEEYLHAANNVWEYIKSTIIDSRETGEWYSEVRYDGTPIETKETVGPWKCPYHNGRMCLEIIKRM